MVRFQHLRLCSADSQGLGQHGMSTLAANSMGEGFTWTVYPECKAHIDLQGFEEIYRSAAALKAAEDNCQGAAFFLIFLFRI